NPRIGTWTAKVTAIEGRETTPVISHHGSQLLSVHGKVSLTKAWGAGATAGDAVALVITGGSSATPGASTAPSTTTPASASAAPGASLTLAETFTSGTAGIYTPQLACTKASDSSAVPVAGTGLSRTITMPADSAVVCVWTNSRTVPLTVVKLSTVISDPVNGTSNPKAIPGAIVEYQLIITNPAVNPIDSDAVVVTDLLPGQVELRVADIAGPGSGPVQFVDGSPASGLSYAYPADVSFSTDGIDWSYVPVAGGDGMDPAVTHVRINPKGVFNANNAQFTLKLRSRIK